MKGALARAGCAMIGQTAQIAPADKKLHALRGVPPAPSRHFPDQRVDQAKKIAEGIDALVLDVKTGSGAFNCKTEADSRRLAESLVSIGNASGSGPKRSSRRWTRSLGRAVGNALEKIINASEPAWSRLIRQWM